MCGSAQSGRRGSVRRGRAGGAIRRREGERLGLHVLREGQNAPGKWLSDRLAPPGAARDTTSPEADLIGFAWTVPWERERTRRLVGQVLAPDTPAGPAHQLIDGRPGSCSVVAL